MQDESNPALHKEFTSFAAYAAYCRAVASGRARGTAQKVLAVTPNAQTRTNDKPLSLTLSITKPDSGQLAQSDPENQQAAREWQSNPALHKEFTSFAAYAGYCRAVASGRARGTAQKVLSVPQNTYMHDKPLSIAPPVSGHHPGGGSFPPPDAADGVLGWMHPVSIEVLNIARDVRANNRHLGRSAMEELIAAKAGVSMEVAITAGRMAVQDYPKRTAHG